MNRSQSQSHLQTLLVACALTLVVGLLYGHSLAMFARGDNAPVERLVENVTKYLAKKPDDPSALYLLGRINSLAFSLKSTLLSVYRANKLKEDSLPRLDEHGYGRDESAPPAEPEQLKKYLVDGVTNYRAAIRLSPNTALYHLSLASVIQTAGDQMADTALQPEYETRHMDEEEQNKVFEQANTNHHLPWGTGTLNASAVPVLRKLMASVNKEVAEESRTRINEIWKEEAIQHYWLAYMLAIKVDVVEREMHNLDIPVSEEAAEHYLSMIQQRGLTDVEKRRVPQIQADLNTLSKRGRAVTPIIFSEDENKPLRDLLAPTQVHFDLDGDGIEDSGTWVSPGTSLLAWDPLRTGAVTSGRQLFGSVTWWIFWNNGYQALAALDDNGDGVLSGSELQGLAVWRDKNGNGISDAGEVVPIEETNIESIAVHSVTFTSPGPSPANPLGLHLKDGRSLPTYDWTTVLRR